MADVLKQSLFAAALPTDVLDDYAGSGSTSANWSTAAGTHDSNDATRAVLSLIGDGAGVSPAASYSLQGAFDAASVSGAITSLRVKFRARYTGTATGPTATVSPLLNGAEQSASTVTTAWTDYSHSFTVDPSDGQPWTNAKVNAQSFGVLLNGASGSDFDNWSLQVSEVRVELWGADVQVLTPSAAGVAAAVGAAIIAAGLVAVSCQPAAVAITAPAVVVAPGAASLSPEAARVSTVSTMVEQFEAGGRDAAALTVLAAFVDGAAAPTTVRSNTAPLYDQSLSTFASHARGLGVGGATGTLTVDGHGGATASINGTGAIGGVVFYAYARARKDAHATLSGWTLCGQSVSAPPVGNTSPPYASMGLVQSALATTDALGNPWSWDTLAAQLALNFKLSCSYAFSGGHEIDESVQVDVAEMWCEVWGPIGTAPEVTEVRARFGNLRRVTTMPHVLGE